MKRFLGFILAVMATGVAFGAHTDVKLFLSESVAKPGSTVTAALHLKMDPGWHTYWKNSGDSGKPTKIQWTLPEGITAGEMEWPVPQKAKLDDLYTYNLHDEVALIVPLQIAANASAGVKALKGKVTWVECDKECIMANGMVEATLTIGTEAQPSSDAARIAEWKNKIPKAISDVEVTAHWEGAGTAEKRSLIFTVSKPDGEWDFFNYQLDNADIKANTERLEPLNGKVRFRKAIEKFDGDWPRELKGLLLMVSDEKTALETTVRIADAVVASSAAPAVAGGTASPISSGGHTLLGVLGLAFLGGLILNIMPCVLPVISLKILGFVRQSNSDPKRIRQLGLVYALGVIVSFMVLAGFVIAVKQSTGSATWGMQFQNPKFLLFITALVTLISLNLFGVFEINLGGRTATAAGELASREGASGAFFNGALATLLATPCTAPFLAPALGFAFTQTTLIILLTFLAIAIGMASPYVLLCWFPGWLKKMPKPGAWMEKFKHAMGFPMLATAIWLFSVCLSHFDKRAALPLGLFLVTIACAAWIYGEFIQRGLKRRGLAGVFATGLLAFAIFYFPPLLAKGPDKIQWQNWTPAAVQAARQQGRPVLVDFTADWCLTCQVNKKTSIEIPSVREKLNATGAIPFLADNTAESPDIVEELKKYERAGVPLVLVFPADPNAPAIVLPEVLTPGVVLEALDKAAAAKNLKMTGK